jgi:hypothetical protein
MRKPLGREGRPSHELWGSSHSCVRVLSSASPAAPSPRRGLMRVRGVAGIEGSLVIVYTCFSCLWVQDFAERNNIIVRRSECVSVTPRGMHIPGAENGQVALFSTLHPLPDRHEQDGVSMEVQELLLARGEVTDGHRFFSFHPHLLQRRQVSDGADDEPARIFEADEASVEQVVDAGCEQQPVFSVEPLFVVGIPPWLAVTSHEVGRPVYPCDPAPSFMLKHTLLEEPLASPGTDDGLSICFGDGDVLCDGDRRQLFSPVGASYFCRS